MKHAVTAFLVLLLVISLPVFGQNSPARVPAAKHVRETVRTASVPINITTPGYDNILTFLIQDFESATFPPVGWTSQGGSGGAWTRSGDASGYGVGAGSAFADFYDISSGVSFSLVSPTFSPTVSGDSVKFDHAYATYTTENDQLQISTSTDGGSTWATLITLAGGVSGPLVTAPPQSAAFVPTAAQWATKRYALPVGCNKIRFTGISAYGNNLYVDNIVVGTPFNNDVGMTSIDAPLMNIHPGTYAPQATVRNFGLTAESFPVTLIISPGGYSSTQNVTSLTPNGTLQLTFANWTPAIGSYTLTVVSQLGTEENRSNDTLSNFCIVSDINRAVLLEFATGTWCQWCPCGDSTADRLLNTYPNMVVLAYHGYTGSTDPWVGFTGNTILGLLGLSAYPTAIFDRQNSPGDFTTWDGYCQSRYGTYGPTPISIAVQSQTYNPTTRQLDMTVGLTSNCSLPGQYKVNCVISEDNIVYDQTGNSTCPGNSSWVHKWVVRNMVNGAAGENVNTGTWNAGQTITKTFSTALNSAWIPANCNVSVFVYKDNIVLGMAEVQNAIVRPVMLTGVTGTPGGVPTGYELSQNYPNPFNPQTNITFSIPKEGFVSLRVFDVTGKVVLTGVSEVLKPGYYNVQVDASTLASGVYFYTLATGGFVQTKKMTVLK